jgi:hypothetical protein
VEDYVDSAVKQALQIHLQPNEGEWGRSCPLHHAYSGFIGRAVHSLAWH